MKYDVPTLETVIRTINRRIKDLEADIDKSDDSDYDEILEFAIDQLERVVNELQSKIKKERENDNKGTD